MARIDEVLRTREPDPRLASVVEEEMNAWLAQLLKHDSNPEKLRKLYAQRNESLLYRLGAGPKTRQRQDIRTMPLEAMREWNSALERQYALTLEYAMRMSNWEHFVINLRHLLQANIVIQSICIPILAASLVSSAYAPGLFRVLQYPAGLALFFEFGVLMSLFMTSDWNRTGKAGASVELTKKQETARIELAGRLESPWRQYPPAGWYEDHEHPGQDRYWEGVAWADSGLLASARPIQQDAPQPAYAKARRFLARVKNRWVYLPVVLPFLLCTLVGVFSAVVENAREPSSPESVAVSQVDTSTASFSLLPLDSRNAGHLERAAVDGGPALELPTVPGDRTQEQGFRGVAVVRVPDSVRGVSTYLSVHMLCGAQTKYAAPGEPWSPLSEYVDTVGPFWYATDAEVTYHLADAGFVLDSIRAQLMPVGDPNVFVKPTPVDVGRESSASARLIPLDSQDQGQLTQVVVGDFEDAYPSPGNSADASSFSGRVMVSVSDSLGGHSTYLTTFMWYGPDTKYAVDGEPRSTLSEFAAAAGPGWWCNDADIAYHLEGGVLVLDSIDVRAKAIFTPNEPAEPTTEGPQ
ncbi:MAG: hypothetical protein JXA57_13305 [Armatimonadetes bacterium]|nr:hypothetical protein [Armatimonadota bacterium]